MEFIVLSTSFEAVAVIDTYESAIWTERFFSAGDVEITMAMPNPIQSYLLAGNYISLVGSDEVMTIEHSALSTDDENGDLWTVTGTAQSALLYRRIIFPQLTIAGNFQTGVKTLLDRNLISPTDASRRIPNFVFGTSSDSSVTTLTVDNQYTGDNLYASIQKLCVERNIGFKVTMPVRGTRRFTLYAGKDHTYKQSTNPYIVMSPGYDNLGQSNYVQDISNHRTVAYVGGEGEGTARTWVVASGDAAAGTGLSRREIYVDARDLSSQLGNGNTIPPATYSSQLRNRGLTELTEYKEVKAFDAEVLNTGLYKFGEDFGMGDIVQLENEYGMTAEVRVTEYIRSMESGVYTEFPSFSVM